MKLETELVGRIRLFRQYGIEFFLVRYGAVCCIHLVKPSKKCEKYQEQEQQV